MTKKPFAGALCLALTLTACAQDASSTWSVFPDAETMPVRTSGDAADDIAVWVNPTNPAQSRIIGTDKELGLNVYALDGALVQEAQGARINNVDVLYGFMLNGRATDLAAGSDRNGNSIALYAIDPESGRLSPIAARVISLEGGVVYGLCAMRSARSGAFYVFVTTTADEVQQWRLVERGGKVDGELARRFSVGGHCEGMVADSAHNALFVAEEDVCIWRYEAEPEWVLTGKPEGHEEMSASESGPRVMVAQVGRDGLTADIEGLTIYPTPGGGGWLIASCQGADTFSMFDRTPPYARRGSFRIVDGGDIDGVSGTDGIAACSTPLGEAFPFGVFVAQDDHNEGGNQNFKIVALERIVKGKSATP